MQYDRMIEENAGQPAAKYSLPMESMPIKKILLGTSLAKNLYLLQAEEYDMDISGRCLIPSQSN